MTKIKPVKRGMWSNYHKTKAKATHHHMGGEYIGCNKTKDGYHYVWHYHKRRNWLETRRFNLHNPKALSLLFHGHSGHSDRYIINPL